jgi:hypothetical protein
MKKELVLLAVSSADLPWEVDLPSYRPLGSGVCAGLRACVRGRRRWVSRLTISDILHFRNLGGVRKPGCRALIFAPVLSIDDNRDFYSGCMNE